MFRSINSHINWMAPGNIIDTFRQSIHAAQIRLAHDAVQHADLCLQPKHFSAKWNDYANFERLIQAGRDEATRRLDDIRALLDPDYKDGNDHNIMVGDYVA